MKQYEIRRVVFVTNSLELTDQPDYVDYIKSSGGNILSTQKCEEGFVCLIHFPQTDVIEISHEHPVPVVD